MPMLPPPEVTGNLHDLTEAQAAGKIGESPSVSLTETPSGSQLLPQQANSKERLAYTSNQQDELEREYRDVGADPRDFIDFQNLPPQKGYRR